MICPKIDLKTYFRESQPGMLGYFLSRNRGVGANQLPAMLEHPAIANPR